VRTHRLAAAALTVVAATALAPAPAQAHGSPTTPISRTAACASGGEETGSKACKAARAANGRSFGTFDNLRIAGVNGKDRQVVPDGKLCSGGLPAFAGLDLPRDDFPATKVTAGKTLRVRYRATIPHAGEFRVFLTKPGYDPSKRLTWDDLGSKPLVSVTDPSLEDGAYELRAKLPARTGRQILYIVWETSSTPDTYYSCSDLVFPAAPSKAVATKAVKPTKSAAPAAVKTTTEPPAAEPTTAEASAPPATAQAVRPVSDTSKVTLGHWIVAGALVLGLGAAGWAGVGAMARRRRENR
jgi:predicted carbohydrate-binding protein with CBM5 and CBM33 domain